MIKPIGSDQLNPLFVSNEGERESLIQETNQLPSLLVSSATAANAVMLGGGYFSPLSGYMNLADAISIAETMQTTDGRFFPVPVLNLVPEVTEIEGAERIALRDPNVEGNPVIAIQQVAEVCPRSADVIQAGNFGAIRTFAEYASPEQKARFLPRLLGGEAVMSVGMSEPEAGSAVTELKTSATPQTKSLFKHTSASTST